MLYQFALPLAILDESLSTLANISYLFTFVYLISAWLYLDLLLSVGLASHSHVWCHQYFGELCVKYLCSFPFGCIIFLWHLQDRSPIWNLAS